VLGKEKITTVQIIFFNLAPIIILIKLSKMKKSLLFGTLLLFVSFFVVGQEQMPNGNFEQWEDVGYQSPVNWVTPNPYISGTLGMLTVLQSADAAEGNYSAYLDTRDTLAYVIPGLVTFGAFIIDFINATAHVEGGIPFTSRPKALTGSYKSYPATGDFCMVIALFTKYNPSKGMRDTIAAATMTFPNTVSAWTNFNLPITFNTTDDPDTMNIIAVSSNMAFPKAGGSMYIDKLAFEYEAGIGDVEETVKTSIFPNPAHDQLSFSFEKEINADLKVFSNDGQLIQSERISGENHQIDVSGMASGTYYYGLFENNRKISSGQFVISR